MIQSPRHQFLKDERVATEHASMMAGCGFRYATDVALLQVIHDLTNTVDPVEAAAAYHRVMGAREYLKKLLTLGDVDSGSKPLTEVERSSLNFKV